MTAERNLVYYGDNLDVRRGHIGAERVDLIYLDPRFKCNATYNLLFAKQKRSGCAAQLKALEHTWRWDEASATAYQEVVESGGKVAQALLAFRMFLADSNIVPYLPMMVRWLVQLRGVLKPTGCIEQKKGADKGIDGGLYLHDEARGGKTKQVMLWAKPGHTSSAPRYAFPRGEDA